MRLRSAIGTVAALAGLGVEKYLRARSRRPDWAPGGGERHRVGRLSVRTAGTGDAVVLLHGLIGSSDFWGAGYDHVATTLRLIVPDLLGFGASDRPPFGYGPDDHALAVAACLDGLGVGGPLVVGAHSLGCVVALRLASLRPDLVAAVVGFGPPLYPDAGTARRRIAAAGPMARLFALPGPLAEGACRWMCDHRELASRVAPLLHADVPPALARDAVLHSWESYSETLVRCLLDAPAGQWLPDVRCPVDLIAGENDRVVDHDFLGELAGANPHVRFDCWPGDHRLPLTAPERCSDRVVAAMVV